MSTIVIEQEVIAPPEPHFPWRRWYGIIALGVVCLIPFALFTYTYVKYARLIDQKLRQGAFSGTSDIYSAPSLVNGRQVPPRLITNVSDRNREKRKIVRFDEIPKVLVNAVLSVE